MGWRSRLRLDRAFRCFADRSALVFLGERLAEMDLAFSQMEVASIALSVAVATSVMRDAESNWLEGVFLLLAYAILGVAFFFF